MFGYIRPVQSELRLKEYGLYRAVYCGLCEVGHFSRVLLNYDYVFFALVRLSITEEPFQLKQKHCHYRIGKKRAIMCRNGALEYTSTVFELLTYYKVLDDIADSRGIKKLAKYCTLPFFKLMSAKARKHYTDIDAEIQKRLKELSELEASGCDMVDKVADSFGRLLAFLASKDLDEKKRRIAAECGYHIGRFIYIIDAYDDLDSDEKDNSYNPFLQKWGSAEEAKKHKNEISVTLTDSMKAFMSAYSYTEGNSLLDPVISNIAVLGGESAKEKVGLI